MTPQGETYGSIVGDDTFPFRGSPQQRRRLMSCLMWHIDQSRFNRQQPFGPRHFPEGQVTVAAQRGECASGSQRLQVPPVQRSASCQILYARKGLLLACLDETVRAASRE